LPDEIAGKVELGIGGRKDDTDRQLGASTVFIKPVKLDLERQPKTQGAWIGVRSLQGSIWKRGVE
jgi:hypothetical protein